MSWKVYAHLISNLDTDPAVWYLVEREYPDAVEESMRKAVRESLRPDVTGTLIGLRRVSDALYAFAAAEDSTDGEFTRQLEAVTRAFAIILDEFLRQPTSQGR